MGQSRVLPDSGNDVVSKAGVVTCKLVCKGWKDVFEFPSVKVILGTEKAGTKDSIISNHI